MRRLLLAAALTIPLLVGVAAAAPTQAHAATCGGVWVVVDYGSLGGTNTKCATSYGTGTAALKSAGFSPTLDGGMVVKISGKPSSPDINKAYWSYWHATRAEDGSYSGWSYSNLGATAYHPTQGDAEGWRYQPLADGKVPPAAAPPATETPAPTPSPTKTTPKPTPKATRSATAKASASAKASATKSATVKASSSTSPSATPSAVLPATPTATPLGQEQATVAAEQASDTPPAGDTGSPVGAIAAGAAVVVGGAGLGGWWFWKGRRR